MARYQCSECGNIYDEEHEGKPFLRLDKDWKCLFCGAQKGAYVKMKV